MARAFRALTQFGGVVAFTLLGFTSFNADAGNLWLTGHDAELHCQGAGPQCDYFGIAADFVRQSAPTKTLPILVLDSGSQVADSLNGAIAKSHNTVEGPGNAFPFTVVDPTAPAFATTVLSVANFSAIIIASDDTCGGCDNDAADIAAINARTAEIQAFFSAGGGILYLAGANRRATYYASVPIPATGVAVTAPFTLTAAGTALGLTSTDVNCCATHNSFTLPGPGSPLVVVETDSTGAAETLVVSGGSICGGTLCGTAVLEIPTMTEWGMALMAGLLAVSALLFLRRRSR